MRNVLIDVLVVDDEEPMAVAMCEALSRAGYRETRYVLGVEDALIAIDLRVPDVLVTDHVMGRRCGDELLERVKADHPEVGRILCSSSVDNYLVEILLESQLAHAVVAKTSDFGALHSAVEMLVERSASSRRDGQPVMRRLCEPSLGVRVGSQHE